MNYLTILNDKGLGSRFGKAAAVFDGMQWGSEKGHFATLCKTNPRILECDPDSVRTALLDCAYSGLTLNPSQGMAYLIPRALERGQQQYLNFTPSYRGLVHMVERAGTVRSVQAVVVRANDDFVVMVDDNKRQVKHKEAPLGKRGSLVGVYVIATLKSGDTLVEVMDEAAINGCKEAAARFNKGKVPFTWSGKFEEEMWKKSCIRRAWKLLPRDSSGMMDRAIEVMEKAEPATFEGEAEEVRQPEPVEMISPDQMTELHAIVSERTGLGAEACDKWLERTAQAMGCGTFGSIPAARFIETRDRLIDRISAWKEARKAKA